jgi:hypothetical protein
MSKHLRIVVDDVVYPYTVKQEQRDAETWYRAILHTGESLIASTRKRMKGKVLRAVARRHYG